MKIAKFRSVYFLSLLLSLISLSGCVGYIVEKAYERDLRNAEIRRDNWQKEWAAVEKTYPPDDYTGKWIWYWRSGKKAVEYNYKNGEQDGKTRHFYLNGQILKEENYLHNELNGVFLEYENNGILSRRAYYYQGLLHGIVEDWNYRGRPIGTFYYIHGEEVTKKDYIAAAKTDLTLIKPTGMESDIDYSGKLE